MREYIDNILLEKDSEINNSVLNMVEMVALMLRMDFIKDILNSPERNLGRYQKECSTQNNSIPVRDIE